MKKYKQLTRDQRYVIKTLKQEGYSYRKIAERIGVHASTVCREVRRNICGSTYYAGAADHFAKKRKSIARKPKVLTEKTKAIIRPYIEKDWSPEQISGRLRLQGKLKISHESIYKFIYEDKRDGGELYKHLRGKHKYRRQYGAYGRFKAHGKKSISERPVEANDRTRVGDWEIDTMVSKKSKDVLVTIVDRKTRFTLIGKSSRKTADRVFKATKRCFENQPGKIYSITADNGTEFTGFRRFEKALDTDVYFAHPYCSYERGTNENTNGLIRQYYPKGASFKKVRWKDLEVIQDKINNRPRKCLGYKTAAEVYFEELGVALET